MTKNEAEAKYDVPCYAQWRNVPATLHPRGWYKEKGIIIPKNVKPDAIKAGGYTRGIYFLFDERKYLSAERLKALNIERRPVI